MNFHKHVNTDQYAVLVKRVYMNGTDLRDLACQAVCYRTYWTLQALKMCSFNQSARP